MSNKVEEDLKRWNEELLANANFRNARQDFILFNEHTLNLLRETEEVLTKKYGLEVRRKDAIAIACMALLDHIRKE